MPWLPYVRRCAIPKHTSQDNEVGYRRPPQHTRFQSGQSGNPKGRPKGSTRRSMMAKLDAVLEQKIHAQENGKQVKLTKLEAYLTRIVNGAVNGDNKHMNILAKLLPLLDQYREKLIPLVQPNVRITFVKPDHQVKKEAFELAKRMIGEALAEFKKTGVLPKFKEPPPPKASSTPF